MKTKLTICRRRAGIPAGYRHGNGNRAPYQGLFSSRLAPGNLTRVLLTLLPALAWPAAAAPVNSASSSAYGMSANITVAGLPAVNTGNIGEQAGTAPPAYSPPPGGTEIGINVLVLASTGVVTTNISSDVDGLSGQRTTTASGRIDGLTLSLADTLVTLPLVSMGGEGSVIASECQVQGDGVTSVVTGSATLDNVGLNVLGQAINLPANPAPNTVMPVAGGVVGLTIYLNEQTPVTGTNGDQIACTAMRIELNGVNVLGLGVLSGEIKAGVSTAQQVSDADGDGVPNSADGDADGDGIPNTVETAHAPAGGDTDGDGVPNFLDLDSDNDGINDVIEGGGTDANGDGRQDGAADADQDGIVDTVDTTQGGTALTTPDTDSDGARDYVDLDSDNDALADLVEAGNGSADTNGDGAANGTDADQDGILGAMDGLPTFGDTPGGALADTDNDGIPNYRDPSSNGPGSRDIVGTGYANKDQNGDGKIDDATDTDGDGIADEADSRPGVFGGLGDADGDGIGDGDEGGGDVDTDGDGNPDNVDADSDADGIPDMTEQLHAGTGGDTDGDGILDRRDLDSDNDGLNDVIEGGGTDSDGNARQDGSADVDDDGLVDTADPSQGGTALPVPDTDGDGARDYVDLDSDNDTVSDLLEGGSGATDTNQDGIVDGGDTDGDGIRNQTDRLTGFGDANDPGAVNTDGTDVPDYIDPDSDNNGGTDIAGAGKDNLDTNGDGSIDGPFVDPDGDGVDARVDTLPNDFGGTGGCLSSGAEWKAAHFTVAELSNEAISGWDADPDQDGTTNAMEFVMGTDPRVISPQMDLLTSFNATTGLTVRLNRDSCSRAFIAVEWSTDLQVWTSSGPGITYVSDSPAALIATVTGGAGSGTPEDRLFVRLRVTVP
jgi:hypothetical protein